MDVLFMYFATYYLAVAFVDVTEQIAIWNSNRIVSDKNRWQWHLFKWFYRKPFNCVFCMSFYVSIMVFVADQWLPPFVIIIPAIAGMASLLHKLHVRLETFIG